MNFLFLLITTFSGVAMTIPYSIQVGADLDAKEQIIAEQIIRETFEEVDSLYNRWNPDSELSALNRLKAYEKKTLSPKLATLLEKTAEIVRVSDTLFDPTIHPLQQLWKQKLELGQEPTQEELAAVKPSLGWDKIHLENGVFWKDDSATQMDLCAIAKGYAVDLLIMRLKDKSFSSLFVEWGGEIKTAGTHPEGRPWRIFISCFGQTDPDKALAILPIIDQAIATSGTYQQKWQVKDKSFSHIFNRLKLSPIRVEKRQIASASVVAPDCALADALATCCLLFDSPKQALAWAEKIQKENVQIRFIMAAEP